MTEIADIFNGKITKWSQLAGNDTTAIKIVFDNAESSTVSYIRDKFLAEGEKKPTLSRKTTMRRCLTS